ncbi:hypothetical protein [Thermotalea metallivorans]|uniref:Uncharacterized protein n=1 Tax=Thermotalea metallivorans TaxID=520762 RepID=A0A140LA04_9FIRM|nr:hypothetical protein [Thermotalea metallivorans]KXG77379.1 hypothetical protein AN619_05050 [Thermotalea metallivorans]
MNRKDIFKLLEQELYGDTNCPDAELGCENCKYIEACIKLDDLSEDIGIIDVA